MSDKRRVVEQRVDGFEEAGILRVTDNVVAEEPRDITAIKDEYGEFDLYSM